MTRIFYPTSDKLSFLLELIHNRHLALPDFQRDFVWDARATEELLESLCQNFPAGSLLRIKNTSDFYFAPHEFTGAAPLDGYEPTHLILDGQQRLTSLYQAFHGVGKHRYFINLQGLIDGKDLEDCVFCEREARARHAWGSIEQQAAALVFPFSRLFGGFEEWLDEVLERRPEQGEEKDSLKRGLRDARRAWLKPVEEYEFPVVDLAENTCASAVCTIFETLNRTGVKLSVFDLLAARFWPKELRLRDLWEQSQAAHPVLTDFEVDPYYVLQAVAIYCPNGAPSCKRMDVLKLTVEQVGRAWEPVVDGFAKALTFLRDECGAFRPNLLPYATLLVPMAAVVASALPEKGPAIAGAWGKIRRWYWCSVFGQAYENAPNSQAAADYQQLTAWLKGKAPPVSVRGFRLDQDSLRHVTHHQRALYRGILTLILSHGARDFHTGQRLTPQRMVEGRIDDHHIFPKKWLEESGSEVADAERDCVLNRTLIDKETDIRIGKSPPSEYLAEIERALPNRDLAHVLSSHLMPAPTSPCYTQDDFRTFIAERAALIREEIERVTTE
jgi:hypothetical protein